MSLAVVIGALALPSTADAGWNRSFSELDKFSEDIAVCEDEVTIETQYVVNEDWDNATYPQSIGMPYPFGQDTLEFYGTELDAVNGVNSVATMTTDLFQTVIGVNTPFTSAEFVGTETIATPAGLSNGEQLWVRELVDVAPPVYEGFALTIGDPIYDCPPAPVEFDAEFLIGGPAVQVRSSLPGILYFDATNINVRSFKIMADNGKIAPVRHLVTVNDTAFVFFKPRRAGVKCSSDSFILTGMTSDGHPVSDVLPIVPFPCPFPG